MREENNRTIEKRALEVLHEAFGDEARFRDGQLDAIVDAVEGGRTLVVQKTGWGKSLVYFVATKILRENGAGPTIVISPLLALMDNQVDAAAAFGVIAVTINSSNRDDWDEIFSHLEDVDALLISPERLSNELFLARLSEVHGTKLFVVDEAHSISDWGHDFRPDYQRISKLIGGFPPDVAILGTTATANDRVINDVRRQLGDDLSVVRGALMRENLAIQVNPIQTREQRLAWLVWALTNETVLSKGQGVIYCLTQADCELVSDFLSAHGVSVLPYHGGLGKDGNGIDRANQNLAEFMNGDVRMLAATVKLGMGYDKPDIRFVVHFQLPQNLIAYYQEIGRAGRDGLPSYAVLLHGPEDEDILSYFIETAQATPSLLSDIVSMAETGVRRGEIKGMVNVRDGRLAEALKYLQIHDYIYNDEGTYRANPRKRFDKDLEASRQEALRQIRVDEHLALLDYLKTQGCFMGRIASELDAPDAHDSCSICANCTGGYLVPVADDLKALEEATEYLGSRHGTIEPRKKHASGAFISADERMEYGWALCADYYSAAGQEVKRGKYDLGSFSAELVRASAEFLRDKVEAFGIDLMVPIPSVNRPRLVADFARCLGEALGVPCVEAVVKSAHGSTQKDLLNSALQEKNIQETTMVADRVAIADKTVLLVDDMVDSRWTLSVVSAKLLAAGASAVYPFALVKTGNGR